MGFRKQETFTSGIWAVFPEPWSNISPWTSKVLWIVVRWWMFLFHDAALLLYLTQDWQCSNTALTSRSQLVIKIVLQMLGSYLNLLSQHIARMSVSGENIIPWRQRLVLALLAWLCWLLMLASYAGFFRQLSKMDPKAEFAEIWIYVVVFLSGGEIVFERAPMCFKHFKNESSSEK